MTDDQELQRAEKHLDDMSTAENIGNNEASWQDFLFRLERFWERTKRRYEKEPWYPKLYGPYGKLRKKDHLLRYLKQARNVETHTIQGTINSTFKTVLKEKYGRPFSIKDLDIELEDKILTISIHTNELFFDFDAIGGRDTPQLVRFSSRSAWFNPPSSHLGKRIESSNPIIVGKLGLDFARSFLEEIQRMRKET